MSKQDKLAPQKLDGEIPEELKNLIAEAGGEKIFLKTLAIAERFTGPIPHPRILGEYAEIMPDAPERIFCMAENQQAHRIDLEKCVITSDIRRADTGLVLGFILFLVFGVGSIILLAIGKDFQGFTLLGTSLAGGIGNFIRVGREREKAKNESTKTEPVNKTTSKNDTPSSKKRKRRKSKK